MVTDSLTDCKVDTAAVQDRWQRVLQRIRRAEQQFQRVAGSVTLVAVSKMQPIAAIVALAAAGHRCFGESYVQEAVPKIAALTAWPLEWHFIGPCQANKTRRIAEQFAWVHSVDRLKIAQRLNEQRPPELPPLNICVQVNLSNEDHKHGLTVSEVPDVLAAMAQLPRLKLRGLMTLPAYETDFMRQRQVFAKLRQLQETINQHGFMLDQLSMGMSDDLEAAIAEGATLVRIGSAIFGARGSSDQ